ncbi:MAG: AAA family ATPase, partial [Treponema sp.]|nr:AAA family ATPase [Treponema sp.]
MDALIKKELTPREVVAELDKYIVGQKKAKRAVAVALRNRIRRLKLESEMREDITPKNILMIGPTGVGKTEIARRLAKLAGSPFIKVEATKYTEVGYVGRDVESMIRDLMSAGVQMVKQEMQENVTTEAEKRAEDALLDLLLPGTGKKPRDNKPQGGAPIIRPMGSFAINPDNGPGPGIMGTTIQVGIPIYRNNTRQVPGNESDNKDQANNTAQSEAQQEQADPEIEEAKDKTREKFRARLREGKLEDKMVEITVSQTPQAPLMMGSGLEDIESAISGIMGAVGGSSKKKLVTVSRAREILIAEELEKLVDRDRVNDEARQRVEQTGIIFIDEIDKIAVKGERGGG